MYILKIQSFAVAIILAVFISDGECKKFRKEDYIQSLVNGKPTHIRDARYMMYIATLYNNHECGATLIHKQFVISAAHCLASYERDPNSLMVVANATYLDYYNFKLSEVDEEITKVIIAEIFLPPGYIYKWNEGGHMDVALAKLESPLKSFPTVKMCTEPLKEGDSVKVLGWGRTEYKGQRNTNQLHYIEVPVVSKEKCLEIHQDSPTKLTDSMVCAGLPGDKDACQGDSGGPALRGDVLCGIVSWGIGCADDTYPGIYTSIPYVRTFIDEVLANNTVKADYD